MVSFQCDGCCDTIKKPALDKHRNRCWATFTCLDCSTTFHGQDYKSHTSCVSEAEKYQKALYKGPKKGQNQGQPAQQAPSPAVAEATPPVETPAAAASAAAIHPSRAHLASAPPPVQNPYQQRRGGNSFPSLHGNGRFQNQNQPREARPPKYSATGANGAGGAAAPMRTWGSAAASPAPEAIQAANGNVAVDAPAPTVPVFESKASKNKKKKDKKGTGSRANTRNPPGAESTAEPEAAPAANPAKKRKAEDSPEPASSATPVEVTDDLRKRLRKNVAKLDGVSGIELSLEEWVEKVKGKKDKVGGTDGVLRGVKVVWQGEGWALSV